MSNSKTGKKVATIKLVLANSTPSTVKKNLNLPISPSTKASSGYKNLSQYSFEL
jgi:hypothetical protein